MSTQAQWQTALGATITVGPVAINVFNIGDEVWLRTDVVGIGAAGKDFKYNEKKLTISSLEMKPDSSGDFLDSTGVVAAGITAASIATDGTVLDTDPAWPHFYRCGASSGKTTLKHESLLIDATGVNTLIDVEVWP